MFANMMPSQPTNGKDSPLNKRRRFAPNMLPVIASGEINQDAPLIHQLCDQSPSQQEIEAQLLQVGMRVRKSVNDGYQNAPGRRAFTPRPFFNSHRLSPETLSAISKTTNENDANVSAVSAVQPLSTATFCGINISMLSHLSTSTPVEEQKLWSYSTASKRRQQFEDESDSDDSQDFMPQTPQLEFADAGMIFPQDYFNIDSSNMSNVSPMTRNGTPQPKFTSRKMAQPRSRVRTPAPQMPPPNNPFAQMVATPPSSFGGHQRTRSCGIEAMDFGEASFLQPRQDVEMDCS